MARKLAKAAMIDKPLYKPAPGFVYLQDVSVGELVETSSGLKAIVVEHTNSATKMLVLKADNHPVEDRNFYLGKQRWGIGTEVKVIGD